MIELAGKMCPSTVWASKEEVWCVLHLTGLFVLILRNGPFLGFDQAIQAAQSEQLSAYNSPPWVILPCAFADVLHKFDVAL